MAGAGTRVLLRPGRERSVLNRHPWVFSGAVARVEGGAADGDVVEVADASGRTLAAGVLNRASQVAVRLLAWDGERVDDELWLRRLERAVGRRRNLIASGTTDAYRLVHGEADGVPGLVADRYGDWLVVQVNALAADVRRELLLGGLARLTGARAIVDRSDAAARARDGLPPAGDAAAGEPPPAELLITEHGLRFPVDLLHGHKTGFYLDQRENRRLVGQLSAGAEVLNAFAYTGGFGIHAAAAGAAAVHHVDTSAESLRLAQRALELNQLDDGRASFAVADAFSHLRELRDGGRRFDVVVLDPPKFAPSRGRLERALRGYKDIALLGLQLLRPGGRLAVFSCSAALTAEVLQRTVFQAAVDACRDAVVLARLGQPTDHPVLLTFPESEYLKGLLLRVD